MARSIASRIEDIRNTSPWLVFAFIVMSYFLVTSGIAYDIIVEPPAVGAAPDPKTGAMKPQAFMPYRINGQYIMEGLLGGFCYTLGGLGFVALDVSQDKKRDKLLRNFLRIVGLGMILISYFACQSFMRIKMPGYMH
eukprot:CAMPEP_0202897998 /NCGR_PEP_ID=MMETSP1392-20130828/6607_1 /ASSEMBLY_ACC=CAM_ASM_000868 /TAXON_ID=225041 /ORGANISM="Chlamydomonas chlamydogama, Strain SAG 11-48b" /LENGTH=136 /DNA_ID=CAMNT_0049583781 /DNA_START=78 /DNA_END=488 /DNA_ORIENTATION=-